MVSFTADAFAVGEALVAFITVVAVLAGVVGEVASVEPVVGVAAGVVGADDRTGLAVGAVATAVTAVEVTGTTTVAVVALLWMLAPGADVGAPLVGEGAALVVAPHAASASMAAKAEPD